MRRPEQKKNRKHGCLSIYLTGARVTNKREKIPSTRIYSKAASSRNSKRGTQAKTCVRTTLSSSGTSKQYNSYLSRINKTEKKNGRYKRKNNKPLQTRYTSKYGQSSKRKEAGRTEVNAIGTLNLGRATQNQFNRLGNLTK